MTRKSKFAAHLLGVCHPALSLEVKEMHMPSTCMPTLPKHCSDHQLILTPWGPAQAPGGAHMGTAQVLVRQPGRASCA